MSRNAVVEAVDQSWFWLFAAIIALYNGAVFLGLTRLGRLNLTSMLAEKVVSAEIAKQIAASAEERFVFTSKNRAVGALGAFVMVSFTWALGNIILYKSFYAADQVESIIDSVGTFYLASSALFAPYAFNQLSKAFRPT